MYETGCNSLIWPVVFLDRACDKNRANKRWRREEYVLTCWRSARTAWSRGATAREIPCTRSQTCTASSPPCPPQARRWSSVACWAGCWVRRPLAWSRPRDPDTILRFERTLERSSTSREVRKDAADSVSISRCKLRSAIVASRRRTKDESLSKVRFKTMSMFTSSLIQTTLRNATAWTDAAPRVQANW